MEYSAFTVEASKTKALSNVMRKHKDLLVGSIPKSMPPRMNMLNLEECELLGDSKYRAYISQVDKALKNFEYTSEWADLISALGKLNKVLSSHVKYPIIPKRVTIGKRLAQCLHPALPSGVHLKALETYDIIFKCIGTPRLAADLFTYSAGIFPLLGYAAMNVKPTLLTLYETHFVPLGKHIKPALLGLLLGVLPGLEEGSEYFDRTFRLLDEFCEAADVTYFHGCLWECVLASPTVRLPAINYVLSHYNRRKSMEDQLYLMGTNIDLLIEAMCTSVQDSSVLVQRSALDLLLIGFPMHNSQLTRPDMVKLITASVKVLLRRDMSLNRRLYAWLLGTDASGNALHSLGLGAVKAEHALQRQDSSGTQNSEPELDYFQTYSKELLITAVKNCIHETPAQDPLSLERVANLKPFRILISLLDKPEIGVAILEDILLEVFRCMYKECQALASPEASTDETDNLSRFTGASGQLHMRNRKKEQQKAKSDGDKSVTTEVIKTANLLFGAFEPYYIWDFIGRTFEKTCENCVESRKNQPGKGDMTLKELCQLVDFLLDKVSLETYQEIQTEHLPDLLRTVTTALTRHCDTLLEAELTEGLKLCSKLLGRVQPSINPVSTSENSSQQGSPVKRPFLFRPEADETTFSESDVFVSADSDNADDMSTPEKRSKVRKKQKTDTDDSNVDSLNMDEESGKAEEKCSASEEKRQRSGTGDSTLSDISSDSFNEEATRSEDTESFNDFVQYGDTVSEIVTPVKIPHLPKHPLQKQPSGDKYAQTLMQNCVTCFQKFFARLVSSRIITDKELPSVLLQQLVQPPDITREYYNIPQCQNSSEEEDHKKGPSEVTRVKLDQLSAETCQTYTAACQMLVDFSSFPMFCTNYHKVLQSSFKTGQNIHFPEWLQYLITCACFIDNFQVQSIAISTLLDLISLTRSVMEESESKVDQGQDEDEEGQRRSTSEGTISVVIIPSLAPKHLLYLNEKTYFYKILALNLWDHLGEWTPQCHTRSVELVFQLHQLAPDPWICEDVIGNSLLSDDKSIRIGACKRFAVLWHLLRDKISGWGSGKAIRTFDRSMFVMMDSLQSDTHPCRAIAQTWLTHTIQRGDIARLLEPILLILFHPDTARISIQHVNIHQPKRLRLVSETSDNQSECSETKIYAISSEGGNVIYHVSNSGKPFSKRTSEELRTFALTSISDGGTGAEVASANVETEFHFDKVNPNDLNLRVNPFGSDHSLDRLIFDGYDIPSFRPVTQRVAAPAANKFPDLQNIKRLDTETCKKEGIFFDDHDQSDEENAIEVEEVQEHEVESKDSKSDDIETASEATEEPSLAAEDVVREILDDIMESVAVSDPDEPDGTLVGSYRSSDTGNSSRHRSMSAASLHSLGADDILNAVDSMSESDIDGDKLKKDQEEVPSVHPLHTHILLYAQKYDSQRTVYALSCLKAILSATPRLVTCAVSTTSLSNASTPHLTQLQNLLIRHRRSVFGKNFFSEVPSDIQATFRTAMFIEILISVCLYFIRSYYPNLMMSKMTEQELNGNKEVQILSCEILMLLLSELINVAKESGRGFSTYINDLLARCKVQKALLHCVLASVYNARIRSNNKEDINNFTDALISFNEDNMDINTNETFQIKLLNLLHVVIVLEDQIRKSKSESDISSPLPTEWEKIKLNFQPPLSSVRFVQSRPIVYQGMLLSAILGALKQQHLSHMHRHWVTMVTSAMPYLNKALSHVVVTVVNQLCRNLELLAQIYELGDIYKSATYQPSRVPPDHLVTLLEAMTTICHYCLLDNAQQEGSVGQPVPGNPNSMSDSATAGHILSNLISVFNPYANNREPSPAKDATPTVNPVIEARRHLLNILPRILASLADLWKSVKKSEDAQGSSGRDRPCWTIGMPKSIRKYILEFLSPITKHHGVNLMTSVAIVWNDRRQRGGGNSNKRCFDLGLSSNSYPSNDDIFVEREFLNRMVGTKMPSSRLHLVLPLAGEDQLLIVDLISSVKVLPTDTLIQMVKLVLKQPPTPSADKNKKRTPVEVSLLQFFYAYVQRAPGTQLIDSWPSLLSLLKDGLQLMLLPSGVFLLLVILNEFVRKLPSMFEDRKDQKEIQEITQKLLEACSETAGSSLTQTTFFRRNLAVKPGPQVDVTAVDADDTTTDLEAEAAVIVDVAPPAVTAQPKQVQEANRQYSVQALVILAELMASLLDVVYRSDEKDRVVPLLNSIMHNVFPYLKNHSSHNLPSFRACCQMLGSLSSYPYTRKAWKKEAFELLMDHAFFQMDEMCIPYWRVIIDNLMTHDKTTFKDLLARVTVNQGAALNLFSSKDAEFEQKALLLKRMSFTIFCSEVDQYQKVMPEIQERLSDSLRMPTVPSLQAQVFFCFRVLVLRISSQHLTSLWPTIITELVHVLLQIEQELSPEVEESKSQAARMGNVDPSWALGNGLNAHTNPGWLKLYLAACKLLDLALVLPTEQLPQFQLYRWAFTGDPGGHTTEVERKRFKDLQPSFVPHVIRLARLMTHKFGEAHMLPRVLGRPLLTLAHIKSLKDLHPFFHTVASVAQSGESLLAAAQGSEPREQTLPKSISTPELRQIENARLVSNHRLHRARTAQVEIEQIIEWDFLEPLPKK